LGGRNDQPRTIDEAEKAGWLVVSNDCSEGASFPGARYAPPGDNPEMVLIFDVNGFIAGMHSVVAKKFVGGPFDIAGSIWYRSDNVLGNDVYLTTAYFVDPELICGNGRDKSSFDASGTGDRLLFQNGPTFNDVYVSPLTIEAADASDYLFKHFCFLNMGRHYFHLNYDKATCEGLVPIQWMYSGGVLNGFVWQHAIAVEGSNWENVNDFGLGMIIDRPPQCLYDLVASPGVNTMHVYLRNTKTMCIWD